MHCQGPVEDVRIGLGYTALKLQDGSAGVALTFRHEAGCGCAVFDGLTPLAGRPASHLLPLLASPDPIQSAVGLACANALVNRPGVNQEDGDILDLLELRPSDHVGMVGHFGPLVESVRRRAENLTIFERIERPQGDLLPQKYATEVLPGCQVALITATTIINHTLDPLLVAAGDCREVVILGASTPLLPEAFAGTPVTLLSGVLIAEPGQVLRIVSEGGGMRQFKSHVRKVNLRISGVEA
jgi:uncharacterized protein (DUF4213/DUF364 family)